jgi:hypothetical protein
MFALFQTQPCFASHRLEIQLPEIWNFHLKKRDTGKKKENGSWQQVL